MFDGISNIAGRVNYILTSNSTIWGRVRMRPLPSARKLTQTLRDLVGLEFVEHGGRHDKYQTKAGNTVMIPRHPGDLPSGLVRAILREAGLDLSLEQFMQA